MSRMLKALKQLEDRSPRPQEPSKPAGPESAPPEQPKFQRLPPSDDAPQADVGIGPEGPVAADTVIEAALARVEIAAAAVGRQEDEAPADSQTASWAIPATEPHAPAYRELAENVLSQLAPGRPAVLMFTSPSDATGKTETLVSLAAALAERTPQRVLLIDGNFRKPDLAGCLGTKPTRGLAQVLMGAATWQQVVQETPVPRLDLLPGVKFPSPEVRPPEQLNLQPLLNELRGHYGLILIDAASLAHAEVAPMASCCDGTYLVVRLRHTARRDLGKAAEVIQDCRGHLLGSVVIGG